MELGRFGLGLRKEHYSYLADNPETNVDWFEIVSENYMATEGRPIRILESLRRDFPIACHGVSMSVGSVEGLNPEYPKSLKTLIDRVEPFLVSDHLAWNYYKGGYLHELIPIPYNEESLNIVSSNIKRVQDVLGREISIENISSYITYESSDMKEWEFLRELSFRTDCKLLLDINNVYVNAVNFGFDPMEFLDFIPGEIVSQIHLAGFTEREGFLFDTHSRPVDEKVWDLFGKYISRCDEKTKILIEWDEEIPDFLGLEEELNKARSIVQRAKAAV
ncbi:DUF692 domain-containing protein [Leptospira idonii]|uniref:DUF692 domain-containing protein n=1 Tax=Leptospira idonii TaxID=1193500 RepID=A0A4R9M1S6_9LEPT|nr:DUF692 domain-containing protein [Leptospira idonii]TGN20680.1 DUF692 domain-containing protein [Leptospira idonii]